MTCSCETVRQVYIDDKKYDATIDGVLDFLTVRGVPGDLLEFTRENFCDLLDGDEGRCKCVRESP